MGWRFVAIGVAAIGTGCATAGTARAPRLDAEALVREADAGVDRGCYVCLKSAAENYERAIAAGAPSVDLSAAGAWTLLALRERELGLRPSDALERARGHARAGATPMPSSRNKGTPQVASDDPRDVVDAYVRIVSAFTPLREGSTVEAVAAAVQAARRLVGPEPGAGARASRSASEADKAPPDPPAVQLLRRRAKGGGDRTASYLTGALDCAWVTRGATSSPEETPQVREDSASSGLMTFLSATCPSRADPARDQAALTRLVEGEPRFHEAHYFLGRFALADRKLVSAEREFLAAADGLPAMTAAWAMLGTTRVVMEEYEWAAADLARALDLEPDQREALLGHARVLNLAGRFEEAIAPAKRLLDLGAWYVSDANYWLAFSELQLGHLHDADAHAREAKRTNPMNGDTARLVGLVAHRLGELERAQAEFELAVSRNGADCESYLHLGMIHGQKERFGASVTSFVNARDCFDSMAEAASKKRGEIETSSLSESRKQVAFGRLARKIQGYRSAQASASLGAAEGETQRGEYERALAHLADAANESPLAGRVSDLRTRIAALQARR